jgi:superfamily II DNA helicase RecQ
MAQLYDAQWRGELHFFGVEDCWLVECVRPTAELAAITEAQLGMQDLEKQKRRQLEQMWFYAIWRDCRERFIRRYFGETMAKKERCGRCDICDPTQKTALSSSLNKQATVEEYLQNRETPELTGHDLDGGTALAFHTFIQNGQRIHTEVGKRVEAFKYHGEKNQLEWLLERALQTLARYQHFKEVNAVAFVPSTDTSRQYLSVPLFAENLRQRLGVTATCQLRKTRATRPQKEMVTMEQKRRNVAGAFAIQKSNVKGQRILLIDDIYDSGATINECARVLKAAGAAKVYALTLTKTGHVAK